MERHAYWNKILHVDLNDRSTWVEEPGDDFYRHYGGGRGIIAHNLLKYVPKGADPLGPDNVLVFAPGVLTGSPVPGAGRPGLRDLHAGIAQLLTQLLLDVAGDLAPQVLGVADLDRVIVDPQVDGCRGDAVHDDAIPPGQLQLRAPEAARLRLAEATGER